jgi:hypothetical protein
MCTLPYRPIDFRTELPQSTQREVLVEEGEDHIPEVILRATKPQTKYEDKRGNR